jgi:quinol monooxygenase YgiN
MSLLYILELKIEPDQVERYLGQFPTLLPETRAFEGCLEITVHQNEDDRTDVVLLEHWASKEAHETYMEWRRERGDLERLSQGLAGPPKTRYFTNLDV